MVDIEDMSSGISIMDLGLNEFRLDLLDYIKTHPEIEKAPHGMNAVVKATEELPAGVIYVLRNIKNEININSQNRLHPFYMVYMSEEGEVIIDHLSPKEMLDSFRLLCKGKRNRIKNYVPNSMMKQMMVGKWENIRICLEMPLHPSLN